MQRRGVGAALEKGRKVHDGGTYRQQLSYRFEHGKRQLQLGRQPIPPQSVVLLVLLPSCCASAVVSNLFFSAKKSLMTGAHLLRDEEGAGASDGLWPVRSYQVAGRYDARSAHCVS